MDYFFAYFIIAPLGGMHTHKPSATFRLHVRNKRQTSLAVASASFTRNTLIGLVVF